MSQSTTIQPTQQGVRDFYATTREALSVLGDTSEQIINQLASYQYPISWLRHTASNGERKEESLAEILLTTTDEGIEISLYRVMNSHIIFYGIPEDAYEGGILIVPLSLNQIMANYGTEVIHLMAAKLKEVYADAAARRASC